MQRRSIFELVTEWCGWLEARGASEHTVDQYWRYLLASGRVVSKDPRDFTEREVVRVVAHYPSKGGGRQMAIRAMRSFFSWAEDAELLVNPARRITIPKPKVGPAERLSTEELAAVLAAAEKVDPRARPALALLYYTGARVGSLCGVTERDIRFDRQGRPSIYFAVAKGDRPYELPVEHPEAIAALVRLLELRGWKPKMAVARRPTLVGVGDGALWGWVKRAGELAGVKAWPHLIRHTTISDLAEDPEVDQRTLIEFANWADGSQIRRYAARSEPRMRAAQRRLRVTSQPSTQ